MKKPKNRPRGDELDSQIHIQANEPIKRLLNLSLRALTLASRFALIFLLAKFLEPAEVGIYGLLVATIAYVLMGLGCDFYIFANRELIATNHREWLAIIRDQWVFYCLTYAALLPFCIVLFYARLLPWHLAGWFFPLVVLEHSAQELNRLLIAMSHPIAASIVLFMRSGLWSIVAGAWMWLEPIQRSLNFVLLTWLAGTLLACGFGATQLFNLDRSTLERPINWMWIKRGTRVAFRFVLATLSLRALNTFDRYWIESLAGLEALAAYVFFVGVANTIVSFLDASVFAFAYPALIANASVGNKKEFDARMRQLATQTLLVIVVLSAAAIVLTPTVVEWIGRPNYTQHISLFYWTLLAIVLSALSMVPHYGLYARHADRAIIGSHFMSLPLFFAIGFALLGQIQEAAVPASLSAVFLFLLVFKCIALRRHGKFSH